MKSFRKLDITVKGGHLGICGKPTRIYVNLPDATSG